MTWEAALRAALDSRFRGNDEGARSPFGNPFDRAQGERVAALRLSVRDQALIANENRTPRSGVGGLLGL